MDALFQVNRLSKSFGANRVLSDTSFMLRAGETLGLVGENGAGKSTLSNIIAGALPYDAGAMKLDGQAYHPSSRSQARRMGVALAHQEPAVFPDLTVAEMILFGREPRGHAGFILQGALHRQVADLIDEIGFALIPTRLVRDLTVAERQMTEILCAVAERPRLLMLDEPTSSLSTLESREVAAMVERLKARGTGILFISHRLDEVLAICDRIVVLKDGTVTLDSERHGLDREALIRAMVGRKLTDIFPRRRAEPERKPRLIVEQAVAPGLQPITFTVCAGEILGFAGLEGQGQGPLARALAGVAPFKTGRVRLDHQDMRISSAAASVRAGIASIPDDRKLEGLALDMPFRVNVSFFAVTERARWGPLPFEDERAFAEAARERFGIRSASIEQTTRELSGGNQQKVVFAKWLSRVPKVLVLHEPTKGVDVATKTEIYRQVSKFAETGVAVVLISSDMLELIGLCDRINIMYGGAIIGSLAGAEASEEAILRLATGPPAAVSATASISSTVAQSSDHSGARRPPKKRSGGLPPDLRRRPFLSQLSGSLRSNLAFALPAVTLVAVVAAATALLSATMFSSGNVINLINRVLPLGLVALGEALVLIGGRIDLSVGSVMSLATVVMATASPLSGWTAIPLALCVGLLAGLLNATGVVLMHINPLIMSLATGAIAKGAALLLLPSPGGSVDYKFYDWLFGADRILAPPLIIVSAFFLAAAAVLGFTRFGRSLYALGSDARAALAQGVPIARLDFTSFAASGLLAAIAGITLSVRILSGDPLIGESYTLDAVTAAILGGVALKGGRGHVFGVLAAVVALVLLDNAFNLLGFNTNIQAIVKGATFVVALMFFIRGRAAEDAG
jgi:ABC-type sugar transport system ATPase subunit/ribose/xylose/arabinose/galactoside ABC-type transport system permease subunit